MNGKLAVAAQDKQKEIDFFDSHASENAYDVFTPETNARLIETCARAACFRRGGLIADLGCGSAYLPISCIGLGTKRLDSTSVRNSLRSAKTDIQGCEFLQGDVEFLPFSSGSLDGVLLSGLLHHLPDPSRCAAEVFRVLKPGGRFAAFDPNRMNPFMYLYRDRSSPLYSPVGVTENERPVLAHEIAAVFRQSGFQVGTDYISNLRYRYLASSRLRWLLPAYNAVDRALFAPSFMKPLRSFVLTHGEKP